MVKNLYNCLDRVIFFFILRLFDNKIRIIQLNIAGSIFSIDRKLTTFIITKMICRFFLLWIMLGDIM